MITIRINAGWSTVRSIAILLAVATAMLGVVRIYAGECKCEDCELGDDASCYSTTNICCCWCVDDLTCWVRRCAIDDCCVFDTSGAGWSLECHEAKSEENCDDAYQYGDGEDQ